MEKLNASQRRQGLIQAMSEDAKSQLHCGSCVGTCCTFSANSMQVDEVQAQDLKDWLELEGRWNESLFLSLQDCVEEFRLDRNVSNIKIRRNYTCPFFTGTKLGCSISQQAKPYGCLAFNPREANITNGGNCRSNLNLLKAVPGQEVGEKKPIPIALLDLR